MIYLSLPLKTFQSRLLCQLGFVVFFSICTQQIYPQKLGYHIHHLGTTNGLSQASNAYVFRDSRGFIWISSIDGLNRFDGLEVKVYRPVRNNPHSLKGQLVNSPFFEDKDGNLWFATYQAITRYNRRTDDFSNWTINDPENNQLLEEDYYAFHLDKKDRLWLRIGDKQKGQLFFLILIQRNIPRSDHFGGADFKSIR